MASKVYSGMHTVHVIDNESASTKNINGPVFNKIGNYVQIPIASIF